MQIFGKVGALHTVIQVSTGISNVYQRLTVSSSASNHFRPHFHRGRGAARFNFYTPDQSHASRQMQSPKLTVLDNVNNAALGVGSVAAISALVGRFFGGQSLWNGGGLDLGWGPGGLPGLRLLGLGHGGGCWWFGVWI